MLFIHLFINLIIIFNMIYNIKIKLVNYVNSKLLSFNYNKPVIYFILIINNE